METTYYYPSPVGCLELTADNDALVALRLVEACRCGLDPQSQGQSPANPVLLKTCKQLDEYFAGKRRTFDLPLAPKGTAFRQKVWNELQRIPYGKTISYAQLAQSAGNPKACRAAGSANGKNPIAIIIPCHRVINTGGKLGGYAYGLEVKKRLLDLEQAS
ncbi:MAG: methylated-DNA--[protein]-cysteine S-methyltransferase [Dysgonamonadaceae bacterium]|jgi:methylated-DNA-[protein]-cysteine S-methyltransferase|nr:methylated-DNA--[protein]-cysteine S-methyltransferase [Dysgonamonadaceae bacterium]